MPFLSKFEKTTDLPSSISAAVISEKFDNKEPLPQKVMLSKPFNFFICFLFLFTIPNSFFVKAATSNVDLIQQNWPFNGIFGRFDKASLQRGFKVYSEVALLVMG